MKSYLVTIKMDSFVVADKINYVEYDLSYLQLPLLELIEDFEKTWKLGRRYKKNWPLKTLCRFKKFRGK